MVNAAHAAAYATAVLADNPIAYYRLGADASDASGNANNGSVTGTSGSVTFAQPSLVPAENDGAVAIAGSTGGQQRIEVPGFDKIGLNGYSAEYWVNMNQLPAGFLNLVGDGTGGGTFFMMNYTNPSGFIRPHFSFANSPVSTDSTLLLTPGTTYHVVTTWDPNALTGNIYFDGTLNKSVTVTGSQDPANESNPVYIGRDNREGAAANLIIDEVAIYDYALSAAQVLNHYNTGINPGPLAPFAITAVTYEAGTGTLGLTWNSSPVDFYRAEASSDLVRWFELADSIDSGGNTTTEAFDLNSFFPKGIPPRLYFRVSPE